MVMVCDQRAQHQDGDVAQRRVLRLAAHLEHGSRRLALLLVATAVALGGVLAGLGAVVVRVDVGGASRVVSPVADVSAATRDASAAEQNGSSLMEGLILAGRGHCYHCASGIAGTPPSTQSRQSS